MYVNVSPHVVLTVIRKHTGLTHDSGQLSPMVDVDENGSLWTVVAEPPSDTDESEGIRCS